MSRFDKEEDEINFDTHETESHTSVDGVNCHLCDQSIKREYFDLNGSVCCELCKVAVEDEYAGGFDIQDFIKSFMLALPIAALGAGLYYAIAALTGFEFGLIAVLIGWVVGMAIMKGSGGKGGVPYQILAVALTYLAIAGTYLPYAMGALDKVDFTNISAQIFIELVTVLILALAVPFLMGFQNIIGLLIIGFGLYQAWKGTKKIEVNVMGPFDINKESDRWIKSNENDSVQEIEKL